MPRLWNIQRPNCRGSQIRIHSQLRIEHWVQLLVDYHDRDLLDWLKFGFPLGYVKSPPKTCVWNYPSVWHHCDAINTYIEKELSHGALIGPFDTPPYNTWSHLNPCITRDKDGGKGKRVIFNLSEGLALSVNGGIPDSVLDSVYRKGLGCLLFSLDSLAPITFSSWTCFACLWHHWSPKYTSSARGERSMYTLMILWRRGWPGWRLG